MELDVATSTRAGSAGRAQIVIAALEQRVVHDRVRCRILQHDVELVVDTGLPCVLRTNNEVDVPIHVRPGCATDIADTGRLARLRVGWPHLALEGQVSLAERRLATDEGGGRRSLGRRATLSLPRPRR